MDGVFVLDKPAGITSRAALNLIKHRLPAGTRLGHCGTLDPMATGVLVACLGRATRLAEFIQALPKVYQGTIHFGATSTTDDADGEITATSHHLPIPEAQVQEALVGFTGEILQQPPAFSAIKVQGSRAYDLARRGKAPDLSPRPVFVDSITIVGYRWPELNVEVRCGKGTYIRSLARDLGNQLGCGGYLSFLRRTQIGPFQTNQSLGLVDIPNDLLPWLLPMRTAVAHLHQQNITADQWRVLSHGQAIDVDEPGEGFVAFMAGPDQLIGIGLQLGKRCSPRVLLFRNL